MHSFSRASSTLRLRAVIHTVFMFLGGVLKTIKTVSAVALVDNTPYLDSLSAANVRDDHSFTGSTGTWSAVGTLLYEQPGNQGDMRAELRRGSTLGTVLAQDSVGNMATR